MLETLAPTATAKGGRLDREPKWRKRNIFQPDPQTQERTSCAKKAPVLRKPRGTPMAWLQGTVRCPMECGVSGTPFPLIGYGPLISEGCAFPVISPAPQHRLVELGIPWSLLATTCPAEGASHLVEILHQKTWMESVFF